MTNAASKEQEGKEHAAAASVSLPLSDLEMAKLCAEAMGFRDEIRDGMRVWIAPDGGLMLYSHYQPLAYDAQAMALVKQFGLRLGLELGLWEVWNPLTDERPEHVVSCDENLNRAIVECVAMMQRAKASSPGAAAAGTTREPNEK